MHKNTILAILLIASPILFVLAAYPDSFSMSWNQGRGGFLFGLAFIVAEISGKIVGYIMCKTEYGFSNFKKLGFVKKGHVVSIAVVEEHRGKGFGKALVDEAMKGVKIRQCNELYLEVRCSNNDAVKLYEKLDFIIKQKLQTYYRDGEDAYLMAIEFSS